MPTLAAVVPNCEVINAIRKESACLAPSTAPSTILVPMLGFLGVPATFPPAVLNISSASISVILDTLALDNTSMFSNACFIADPDCKTLPARDKSDKKI